MIMIWQMAINWLCWFVLYKFKRTSYRCWWRHGRHGWRLAVEWRKGRVELSPAEMLSCTQLHCIVFHSVSMFVYLLTESFVPKRDACHHLTETARCCSDFPLIPGGERRFCESLWPMTSAAHSAHVVIKGPASGKRQQASKSPETVQTFLDARCIRWIV